MHALYTNCFYVHAQCPASLLVRFLEAHYNIPVYLATEVTKNLEIDYTGRHLSDALIGPHANMPRVFLAGPDLRADKKDIIARFDPLYGDVVEYEELNDVLQRVKREAEEILSSTYERSRGAYAYPSQANGLSERRHNT